jgi:phosphatidylserine decarboxylase
MKFHHEGNTILFRLFAILVILNIISAYLHIIAFISLVVPSLALLAFVVMFFRSPKRDVNPADYEGYLLSPADGRVIKIENTMEKEYFKKEMLKISIFMSVTNVHLNRIPVSGKIVYQKYHPGKKMVAFHPKSSHLNERNTVVIEDKNGEQFLLRQIAGTIARRIRYYVKEGDVVTMGQELGFIKFGSRVDIFLPVGTELVVKKNQNVKGNISIIAKI